MATPIHIGAVGGEYMDSVLVSEWTVEVGATVAAGDIIVVVETAKAATEVEAPTSGILTAILAPVGAEVPLDAVLGAIGSDAADTVLDGDAPAAAPDAAAAPAPASAPAAIPAAAASGRIVASPAARREARRSGVALAGIVPSSPSGRIKLRDLVDAPAQRATPLRKNFSAGALKVFRSGAAEGVPALLLHGFGSDSTAWHAVERALAPVRPVLRMDLPGHGQSAPGDIRAFEELAAVVAEAFDALGLVRVHLVGHSLGGAAALALAARRPGAVASLSLIAPGGLGSEINGDFIEGLAAADDTRSLAPWLRAMVCDDALVTADYVAAAMAARASPDLRAEQGAMGRALFPGGTQDFDLKPALARVDCPTALIWGRADDVVPFRQAFGAPGRTALHLFDNVGHLPQVEATAEVVAILKGTFAAGEAR